MRRTLTAVLVAWVLFLLTTAAFSAGIERSENFIVMAPDHATAVRVLRDAERRRAEVAKRLFGHELPPGIAQTIIHVDAGNSSFTWAADDPDRRWHTIYLSDESALGHEVAHALLATRHADLPAWINEGVACQFDDAERKAKRLATVRWFAETGRWPDVRRRLEQPTIDHRDVVGYALSESFVAFLVDRYGATKVLGGEIDPWKNLELWKQAVR